MKEADDVVAVALQEQRRDGRVDPPGHADDDSLSH
jgi:hypothetical protein